MRVGRVHKVKISSREIQRILNSDGVRDYLVDRMQSVEDVAKANAPIDTGNYLSSINLRVVYTDRVVARVYADAPHSLVVESRTGNLSRALDAAGG